MTAPSKLTWFGLALVIVCLLDTDSLAQRVFLDGFAAKVNETVILRSQVDAERAIIRAMAGLAESEPSLVSDVEILDELINRELLLQQALRFLNQTIYQADIDAQIEALDHQFGSRDDRKAFMKIHGISDRLWQRRARNLVMLRHYLEQRVMAFIRVSQKDEDEYILLHQKELGLENVANPIEAVPLGHTLRKSINKLLELQAADSKKQSLIADLRSTAKIEYTSPARGSRSSHEAVSGTED